ncbi:MAG: UDP-glucose 4-epimerase GalE [Oscillospiraceae bacterium]|jgi:UDP-glucose 4-epimerase|nr:UDP-glucose 4-epimerase GalE [Oscillospiraceae bacterium]
MSVLVTGGTGYIGSHTVAELLAKRYDVIILDNLSNSKRDVVERIARIAGRGPQFVEGDIRDKALVGRILVEEPIEAVIHFAGSKAVGESVRKPLEYYHNNVYGTICLLEAMREAGCKSIVFSSSATVYGGDNPSPLREDMPEGRTTNPYGSTKLTIEHILRELCISDPEWGVSLLRYFNPIGAHKSGLIGELPNGEPNNLMPYITQVAAKKLQKLKVFGNDYNTPDGTGVRDYIHVVDLAKGHLRALERLLGRSGCETFNLGTGQGYSVLELVHTFVSVTKQKVPYEIVARREGDIAECYSDPSLAAKELGWKAELGLGDMCADSWRWETNAISNE